MTRAFIGLGSNVGDRLDHLKAAVSALRSTPKIEVVRTSSVYETEPVGPPQDDFLNAVAEVDCAIGVRSLLRRLKEIEREVGRVPRGRWEPREIDLDLLIYGDERIDEEDLRIPHPEIANRAFVLVPLEEIAPELDVPHVGSVASLLARAGREGVREAEGDLLA